MPFAYLRDPLFVGCVLGYFVNRLLLKPHTDITFFHAYLNDLICLPFWVPIMLWVMRKCRLRMTDGPPEAHEVIVPLLIWSAFFEVWLPTTNTFRGLATADPNDILCYTAGGIGATLFWRLWYGTPRPAEASA